MKVILRKDMDNLGNAGDVVSVKNGYGRNFLIPRGFALAANEKNLKDIEFKKKMIRKQIDTEAGKAKNLAEKLSTMNINIEKKVGQEGKLFGSVTTRDIAESLEREGVSVDKKNIKMRSPIKKSGVYEVDISLFRDISGSVKVWVVAEDQDVSEIQKQVLQEEEPVEEDSSDETEESEEKASGTDE